jgi:hypothetical protein
MQAGNKGTVSAQTYTDTVITLETADPKFVQKQKANGYKPGILSGLKSEEGGKVWKIAKCQIPAMRTGVETYPATGREIV